jgi:hypothetical protein
MDTSIRIYASLKAMNAEEYRYWQSRPVRDEAAAMFQDFKDLLPPGTPTALNT